MRARRARVRIGFGEASGTVLPAGCSPDRLPRVKTYRYYDLILGAYVCVLLCANLIGAAKETTVHCR